MANLKEIRKRISSVQNIKQITKSMEMVAAARLAKAAQGAHSHNRYLTELKKMIERLAYELNREKYPLLSPPKSGKEALIIVSSDRGHCGPFNSQIFSKAEKKMSEQPEGSYDLFIVGKKGVDHFKRKRVNAEFELRDWSSKNARPEIDKFVANLLKDYELGLYNKISVVYTHFISNSSRKILVDQILPLVLPERTPSKKPLLVEPSVKELFDQLLPFYFKYIFETILKETYAAELAARVASMRAATKNAEEVIDELTLVRNKLRQSGITTELLEIITSAEAMK